MIVVMLRLNYLRYLKFALVGGTNFLLELGIFNFIVIALHWNSEWGKIIGATVTTILAYFANKHWVFKTHEEATLHISKETLTFAAVNLACLVSSVLLYAWLIRLDFVVHLFDNAGGNQTLRLNFMNCVTIVAISVARYLSYKHWVFPHAK